MRQRYTRTASVPFPTTALGCAGGDERRPRELPPVRAERLAGSGVAPTNGISFNQLDRQRLKRMSYEGHEQPTPEEVSTA
jgi:hypothetical protein